MELISYDDILKDYFFSKTLRPATEWSYRKVINSFRRYIGDNVFPGQVDRLTVLNWRRHVLSEQGLSSITWNNKVAHMRAIYNHALQQEFVTLKDNPFNGVIARPDIKRKKTLTESEIKKIYLLLEAREKEESLGIIEKSRSALRPAWFWLSVVDTLRYTGMRQNQLLNIRLEDVHLEGGWINLRPEASKNHREHRVPITRLLRPRLERLMLAAVERGAAHGDMLFNASRFDGRKNILTDVMAYQPLRGFFRRLSTECQCVITPHRFRHTIATDMMKSPDRNLKVVQTLLGHSSVAVTLEYVEGNMDSLRVALDEVFGG
ncbi:MULTISPECIES: tyrosine-type recombinase/integrase [Enterobacterales]|jgi:integrase|uniref:tyrosine-type recombinase/integrase n=1 Tax=Enterobacterales TaxID=91347 RepID=UPI000E07841D|nr:MULTISPECIES: site-specific integrase [Enterobacterales]AYA09429.1 site-specific integrase [Rahnella aquatilis]MDW5505072.1 site-specific integrase [Pseudomonas lundensis]MBU9861425.1 site-specific integrase [Rahnella aceris]MCI4184674.1 site-specific integrase [Dickeya dianthicola]MDW5500008.1 site-specific integrase [Serratia proteamaculans]